MSLIEKFAEKILVEKVKGSFDIGQSGAWQRKLHFIQDNVGDAVFVYALHDDEIRMERRLSHNRYNYNVVAVVSNGKIYITDPFLFDMGWVSGSHENLPNNVYIFNDVVREYNDYANNVLYKEFYEKLPLIEAECLESCKNAARRIYFYGEQETKPITLFIADDLGEILCGFSRVDKIINERLEDRRETYIKRKAHEEEVKRLLSSGEVVTDIERKIYEGLKSVNATTVNVTFEVNRKIATEKMNVETLIRYLYNKDSISWYGFTTEKKGKDIIENLVGKRNYLSITQISRITYGKKTLYEAEDLA